jgi:hypothetical protein
MVTYTIQDQTMHLLADQALPQAMKTVAGPGMPHKIQSTRYSPQFNQ